MEQNESPPIAASSVTLDEKLAHLYMQGLTSGEYHKIEMITRECDPELGEGYESKCLPSWIKTFCDAVEKGEAVALSVDATKALCHTLIAARFRNQKLSSKIFAGEDHLFTLLKLLKSRAK